MRQHSMTTTPPSRTLFIHKISFKLPAAIILAAIISALSAGYLGYQQIDSSLTNSVDKRVEIILNHQKQTLNIYLGEIENDLHQKATSTEVVEALTEFNQAWEKLGSNQQAKLQKAYIDNNPNKLGEKEKLDFAAGGSEYDKIHKKYHPRMRDFLQVRGYYDIFLFNLNGDLVYTVFKELDYATNLATGEYNDTGLGTVFKSSLLLSVNQRVFDDFKPYSPSHGAPASFIAEPIFNLSGTRIGVIAYQMPIHNMNDIMKSHGQLGQTGETFIIGSDGLMRSDSELHDKFKILETKVTSSTINDASFDTVNIKHGEIFHDKDSIMAATNLEFLGTVWTLVATQETDEIFAPLTQARNYLMIVVTIVLLLVGIVGLLLSRSITKPITKLTEIMLLIAGGEIHTKLAGITRSGGEIGEMAKAILVFKNNAIANVELEKQQVLDRERMEAQSAAEQQRFATDFKENIMGFINSVSQSCHDMSQNTTGLIDDAAQTSSQSASAMEASERANANVQTVASASEELTISIEEISRQIEQNHEIVNRAMNDAERTNQKVSGLSKAANDIGEVINLIQSIAEQTNLLALNATIEAARAGDAGRGFAVVASEVKALASQTAKATDEISSHINSIQKSTNDTVEAIGEITNTMTKANEITITISEAIERQGSATTLISHNIQNASSETQLVSDNMKVVSEHAEQANRSAQKIGDSSNNMSNQTQELQDQVNVFINKLMAG